MSAAAVPWRFSDGTPVVEADLARLLAPYEASSPCASGFLVPVEGGAVALPVETAAGALARARLLADRVSTWAHETYRVVGPDTERETRAYFGAGAPLLVDGARAIDVGAAARDLVCEAASGKRGAASAIERVLDLEEALRVSRLAHAEVFGGKARLVALAVPAETLHLPQDLVVPLARSLRLTLRRRVSWAARLSEAAGEISSLALSGSLSCERAIASLSSRVAGEDAVFCSRHAELSGEACAAERSAVERSCAVTFLADVEPAVLRTVSEGSRDAGPPARPVLERLQMLRTRR